MRRQVLSFRQVGRSSGACLWSRVSACTALLAEIETHSRIMCGMQHGHSRCLLSVARFTPQ
eukprot:6476465-Amphidinium_carterae.1